MALRIYKSEKQLFTVDDFANINTLEEILIDVGSGGCTINHSGTSFIKKYYGVDNLAKILSTRSKFIDKRGLKSLSEISSWLQELVKFH